jgi:hypothetical protein
MSGTEQPPEIETGGGAACSHTMLNYDQRLSEAFENAVDEVTMATEQYDDGLLGEEVENALSDVLTGVPHAMDKEFPAMYRVSIKDVVCWFVSWCALPGLCADQLFLFASR